MGHRTAPRVPALARWIAALSCAAFIAGCGEGAPTEAFELSGVVTVLLASGEAGGPIADADVRFVSDTLIVSETTTDGSGRYRMTVLTDFPFGQVVAAAPGFLEDEETVFFDSPRRRVDLALRRAPGD